MISDASPCVGGATPIAFLFNDFDNDLRNPCTPDIGADEVTPYKGPPLAHVSITKTADAGVVVFGSQVGFTVTLTNDTAFTATGLTFTDNLPAAPGVNWSIDAGNTDPGWSVVGSPPNQSLVYGFSTLPSGAMTQAHVISSTAVETCGSTLNNMASFTISNGCPGASSGSASASVSVVGVYLPTFSENFDSVTPPALPLTPPGTSPSVTAECKSPVRPRIFWNECPEPEVRAHCAANSIANFGFKGALES